MSLESGEKGGAGRKDAGLPGPGAEGPSLGTYAGHGIAFAISILVFLWVGKQLDQRLHTAPWLMIGLMFVGAGASFYSMYRKLMTALEKEEAEKRARRARERDERSGGA